MTDFIVICFDVCDPRRLRRVSNELENFGTRVQKSIFECHLDERGFIELKNRLSDHIDEQEDHVRYYRLCPKDRLIILVDGIGRVTTDVDFHLF